MQGITTGMGIEHSEFNRERTPALMPVLDFSVQKPSGTYNIPERNLRLQAGKTGCFPWPGQGFEDALKINTDATVYLTSLEKGHVIHFDSKEGRFVFIYVSVGEFSVNGQELGKGDQARLEKEKALHLDTASSVEFVLIDISANREK